MEQAIYTIQVIPRSLPWRYRVLPQPMYAYRSEGNLPPIPLVFRSSHLLPGPGTLTSKVNPQPSPIKLPRLEKLRRRLRTLHIHKVRMRKTPRLPRPPINRNSHIQYILDLAEQVVQVLVAHLIAEIADKERLGWCVDVAIFVALGVSGTGARADGVLHDHLAAFELLAVEGVAGGGGGLFVVEFDVAEAGQKC